MGTYTEELVFTVVTCYKCGIPFGILSSRNKELHRTGVEFWCPNGHPQIYGDSTEEQLKRTEADLRWWKDQAQSTARSLSATRGVLTKTKKRIANGICPCCHRSFVSVAKHMKNQHPDYVEQGE